MSTTTLLVTDVSRSGVSLSILPPSITADGDTFHPFLWNDNYWKPEFLEEELVTNAIVAAESYRETLSGFPSVSKSKRDILKVIFHYFESLTQIECQVKEKASVNDFVDVLLVQVNQARSECIFNVAMIWFLNASAAHSTMGSSVRQFEEAAGLFDFLLGCEMNKVSVREELSPDNLRVMASLSMAVANEVSLQFHYKDSGLMWKENSELAHAANFYFSIAAANTQESATVPQKTEIINFCEIKRAFYEGLTYFLLSIDPETVKGDSRRRRAIASFDQALQHTLKSLPGDRRMVEMELKFFSDRCTNFKKLRKKGKAIELGTTGKPKRSLEMRTQQFPLETLPKFPTELEFLMAATPLRTQKDEGTNELPAREKLELTPQRNDEATSNITVKVNVPDTDLRLVTPPIIPGDVSAHFHHVESLVSVQTKSKVDGLARVACVFIVDLTTSNSQLLNTLKEIVSLAIESARFSADDIIGVVMFDSAGEAQTTLVTATSENIEKIGTQVMSMKGRGQFAGSKGTPIMNGVLAAISALQDSASQEQTAAALKCSDIILVSDGFDNTAYSDQLNWKLLVEKRSFLEESNIRIHTIALSSSADRELLRCIAMETKGNNATLLVFDEERIDDFRHWFVSVISNLKKTLARGMKFEIDCAEGILIAAVSQETEVQPPLTKYASLPSQGSYCCSALTAGNAHHIKITFAVPHAAAKQDVVLMGDIKVTFWDPMDQTEKEVKVFAENICADRVIDRSLYTWLDQCLVETRDGKANITTPSGFPPHPVLASDTFCEAETIVTDADGSAVLVTVEGCRFEVQESTSIRCEAAKMGNFSFIMHGEGAVNISTVQKCEVLLEVEGIYKFLISENTIFQLSVKEGLLKASCVDGTVNVVSLRVEGEDKKPHTTLLCGPRQTSARVPDKPVVPWMITEDMMDVLVSGGTRISKKLSSAVAMETQRCRLMLATTLRNVARWLERAKRSGSLIQTKASVRCRTFLMNQVLIDVKQMISNSIAYVISNPLLDVLRVQLDDSLRVVSPANRGTQSWGDSYGMWEASRAIREERPIGVCKIFDPADNLTQVALLLNERDRKSMEKEQERLRLERESFDAEARRRREIVTDLFPQFDFQRQDAVSFSSLLSVLRCCDAEVDGIQVILSLAVHVAETVNSSHLVNLDQFVSIMSFCGAGLEAFEFNSAMENIDSTVSKVLVLIEKSRFARAGYGIYTVMDSLCRGHTHRDDVERCAQAALGDSQLSRKRIEDALANVEGAAAADGIFTMVMFMQFIDNFSKLGGLSEKVTQHDLEEMFHARRREIGHYNNCDINFVIVRERKEKELRHLRDWDARHVFDGVASKSLLALLSPSFKKPERIQEICAPVCILAGLCPIPADRNFTASIKSDYWLTLRTLLRRDPNGLFEFLKDFPLLSVSHRQVHNVSQLMVEPQLDPSVLYHVSPVLAALLSWVKLTLRLVNLFHNYDVPPVVCDRLLSSALAEQSGLGELTRTVPIPKNSRPPSATPIRDQSTGFCHHFQNVFAAPAVIGVGDCSRYAQLSLAEASRKRADVRRPDRPQSAAFMRKTPSLITPNRESIKRPSSAKILVPTPPRGTLE